MKKNRGERWSRTTETDNSKKPPTQPVLAILHGVSRRMQETLLSIINEVKHL